MTSLTETGASMVADMPQYAQDDRAITALLGAVGRELDLLDGYLTDFRNASLPQEATGDFLAYWEGFLDLPINPVGVTESKRHDIVRAAIARRTAGAGAGWYDLLSTIIFPETFRHSENSDATGSYAPYELSITDVTVQLRATAVVSGTQTGLPSSGATLTVDATTGFALSGAISVGGAEVFFTGKTSTTFTGVSGLPSSVTGGTLIVQRADYRAGIFTDTVRRINPAHLEVSEIEIAGADTFRTGMSKVGDDI